MPKTLSLGVVIGASVGSALKSVGLVTNSTKVLGTAIEKLNSKKVKILEGIDKEFKAKLEPIENKLKNLYTKQKDIKLKIKVKDNELKEFQTKIKTTDKEIKSLEKEKLNLEKEFKKGAISAEEFENKTKEIENELTKLNHKKLGLDKKIKLTEQKSNSLKNSLNSVNKTVDKLKDKKIKLSEELEKAKEKAKSTNKELLRIGSTIEKLNNRKIKIEANIEKRDNLKSKAMDTIALGASIAAPFKAGIEFESSMARVKALSGATGAEFKKLEDKAKELGSTTTFSASQAAEGMQKLAMAGFSTNEITKAMPGLLDLAAAGQTDLGETSDITSNILSGFGIKASKTGHVADVLAKAMTTANVDVGMLGETMKYVGPAASSLGASLEETTALAAQLGNVGIQGSDAGTALRSMYLRMASPPSEARKTIKALGLETKDANGKFVGMTKVIEQLQKKTKGLSNTKVAEIMKNLFGTEAVSASIALTKVPIDKLKKYEKSLENADGTAKKIAKTQNDTVAGSFKALGSAVEGLSISFSSLFLPVIQNVTKGITWFASKLNGLVEHHKTLATVIGGAVAGFGVLTVASFALGYAGTFVANAYHKTALVFTFMKNATLLLATTEGRATLQTKLLSFWNGVLATKTKLATISQVAFTSASSVLSTTMGVLGSAVRFVGSGVMWLGRALMANPIGLAITVIAGGAYLIYSNWDKLKGFFTGLWNRIKSIFSGGASVITTIFLHPINTIQKYWHKLIAWIGSKLEWITSIGSKIKHFLGFGGDEKNKEKQKLCSSPVIEIGLADAVHLIYSTWGKVKGFFSGLCNKIKSIFSGTWNRVKSILSFSPIGIIVSRWNRIKIFFSNFWNNLKGNFAKGTNFITNIFISPINTIQKYWHKLIGWISAKLKWITSIGSKIKNFFGGDDKDNDKEKKELCSKPVNAKIKPIVSATVIGATVATAQPTITQLKTTPITTPTTQATITPAVKPQSITSIQNSQNIQHSQTQNIQNVKNTPPAQPDIIYNFNFGGIKVETKDGKIANPEHLKEEIKKVIEEINFDHKQRSLSDVV